MPEPARRAAGRPTAAEALLLRAVCADHDVAVRAWRLLAPTIDVDRLEGQAYGLLPLLHLRAEELGLQERLRARVAGVYKKAWFRNHTLLRALEDVVRRLQTTGCEPVVVGAAAVALLDPATLGSRPLHQVEIRVRAETWYDATTQAGRAGWSPRGRWRDGFGYDVHGFALTGPRGERAALRWSDAAGFADAVEVAEVAVLDLPDGGPFLRAGRADTLVHAVVEGARRVSSPTVRWLADSAVLLRSGGVDWQRVHDLAVRRGAHRVLAGELGYAADLLGLAVPADFLDGLRGVAAGRFDTVAARLDDRRRVPRWLPAYLRRSGDAGALRAAAGLPAYLRDVRGPAR